MLETLRQHTHFALRSLRRSPSFTIVAVLTLALGIGSATAVFGVLSAAFLRPLPYQAADRLISIAETKKGDEISVSYPNFLDWREQNRSFTELAAFAGRALALGSERGSPERLRGQVVTANLFRTLGVAPIRGRAFLESEDRAGTDHVVIIGHGLWQRRFGGVETIVGTSITLEREPYTIVGVMPPDFDFPGGLIYSPAEMWMPMGVAVNDDLLNRMSHPGLGVVGRLRPGVTLGSARADLAAIASRLTQQYPATNREQGVLLRTMLDGIVGELRPGLSLAAGAVALLLLITCANVAGLFLARAVSRHREIAIRSALGASRERVVGQLVVESLLLALIGGVAGVTVGWWGIWLAAPALEGLPRLARIPLDWRVIAFALAVTLVTGLLYGVGPALTATGSSIDKWLRDRGRSAGILSGHVRRWLVGGEIALSLMLVVGATLLGRSFANLRAAPGGIDPNSVLTFELRVPEAVYGPGEPVARFYRTLIDRIATVPGVSAVGGVSTLPFTGGGSQSGTRPVGTDTERRTDVAVVTPDYFRAMGMELLRGRLFTAADDSASTKVAVVDERLARTFWPNADPIGKRIEGWGFHELTVIGVVRHVKNHGVAAESREELFVVHAQRPLQRMIMAIRGGVDPQSLAASVRRIVGELDVSLPVYNVRTMNEVVGATVATPRLSAAVSGVVAGLALLLATVGLYGVLAFTVGQRRHEIGVRMALGAAPRMVAGLIVTQALVVAIGGISAGVAGTFVVVRLVRTQLFGVSPMDLTTFVVAATAFVGVTILASWIPARRAAGVSPVTALRAE
jgi:putative ABC transport system permease protein